MVSVLFDYRLVCDRHFFNEVIKLKEYLSPSKPGIMQKLMYINDKADGHSRTHNIMSKKIFQNILSENKSLSRGILRASFWDCDEDKFEEIEDEMERNIKLAIDVLDEKPNRTIILTSTAMVKEYGKNPHYIKEISVKAGMEAITIIDTYFESCQSR